jgi:hypothetical protein
MEEELLDNIDEKIAVLGDPIAEFAVRGRVFLRNLVIAPLLLLLGIAIEIGAFWGHAFNHFHIIAIGGFLILMAVMLVVRAVRNRGLRVLVFPEGLVRLWRGDGQSVFWNEVDKIWKRKIDGHWARAWQGSLVLKIERYDGRTMEFDDSLPRLDNLSEIIHRETLPYLLPQAAEDFTSGRTIAFGKLRVDRAGLKHESISIPWGDVQEIRVDDSLVAVYKKGKWSRWCQVPIAEIPNLHVLLALAQMNSVKIVTK